MREHPVKSVKVCIGTEKVDSKTGRDVCFFQCPNPSKAVLV